MSLLGDPRLPERFWSRVQAVSSGCWEWTGRRNVKGYGFFDHARNRGPARTEGSHRVAYRALVGEIPDGLELDHLCKIRHCCNPAHLEAVTHAVNMARSEAGQWFREAQIAKTHCPHGHAYDESNTYIVKPTGARACRACAKIRTRTYRARKALMA